MNLSDKDLDKNRNNHEQVRLSLVLPKEIYPKIEYIKSRTFLSKKQIILMSAGPTIESWCKKLMDEEVAIRTGNVKIELPQPAPTYSPPRPSELAYTNPIHKIPVGKDVFESLSKFVKKSE